MERGSAHHAPRVDDELAHESAPLLHGSVLTGRDREDLEPEAPTLEESVAVPEPGGPGRDVLAHQDVLARSELARWLLPSAFPARASALATVARNQDAPESVVARLEALGRTEIFETVGELWTALGGTEEHHSRSPRPVPVPPAAATRAPPRPAPVAVPVGDAPEPVGETLVQLAILPARVALATVRIAGRTVQRALGRGLSALSTPSESSS